VSDRIDAFPPTVPQDIFMSSPKNREVNKNFKIPQKIPNISRNLAGIFVRQLAVLA
jgi:hypothetical protein